MISYNLNQRRNPLDENSTPKYYASVCSSGVTDIKEMAQIVSRFSTVSRTDCVAVLTALLEAIPSELLRGNIVSLGELGSLRTTVKSEGVLEEEEFHPSKITQTRVRFRPSMELKKVIQGAEFKKTKSIG